MILRDLKLDHVEFWLAMSDDPVDAVDEKVSSFSPALTDDTGRSRFASSAEKWIA